MKSKTPTSSLQRLVETRRNIKTVIALIGALVVIPSIGAYLVFFTEGTTRAIGPGFFVYSFALFVALPALILAASDDRGSNSRLFASFGCFVLAFFTFFYLEHTTNRQDIKFIATIPITLLGLIFAGWWAKDCMYIEDPK